MFYHKKNLRHVMFCIIPNLSEELRNISRILWYRILFSRLLGNEWNIPMHHISAIKIIVYELNILFAFHRVHFFFDYEESVTSTRTIIQFINQSLFNSLMRFKVGRLLIWFVQIWLRFFYFCAITFQSQHWNYFFI